VKITAKRPDIKYQTNEHMSMNAAENQPHLRISFSGLETSAVVSIPQTYLSISRSTTAGQQTWLPRTPCYRLSEHIHIRITRIFIHHSARSWQKYTGRL